MSPHPAQPRRSPLFLSLLALLAIIVGLTATSARAKASAPNVLNAETAVGRTAPLASAHVRPNPLATPRTPRAAAYLYDQNTVATGVAAKGVEAELPGLLSSAPKPLGLGSTGRTVPGSIREQMAMASVRNNPAGEVIQRITMNDARWPAADGWVKVQQVEGGVTIHYVRNTVTGAVDDFKFVSP